MFTNKINSVLGWLSARRNSVSMMMAVGGITGGNFISSWNWNTKLLVGWRCWRCEGLIVATVEENSQWLEVPSLPTAVDSGD